MSATNTNLLTRDGVINPETVRRVSQNIGKKNHDAVRSLCKELHFVDFADLIESLPPIYRSQIVTIMGDDFDSRVWMELNETVRDDIAGLLDVPFLSHQVAQLDSHDALFLIHHLPEKEQQEILADKEVPVWEQSEINESLHYKEGTAGHMMHHAPVTAPSNWTVRQVDDYMTEQKDNLPKKFLEVYLLDDNNKPLGSVPLHKITSGEKEDPLTELLEDRPIFIPVDMSVGEVAYFFKKYHLVSVGVVNEVGHLVGRITADDMVGIVAEESAKELKHLAGLGDESFFSSVGVAARSRFKWLFVNLITAIIASAVISVFDATIEQLVALAVLMPIVASMGGVAGTQTLTIAVRAIATHDLRSNNQLSVLYRELLIGSMNGFGFAVLLGFAGGLYAGSFLTGLILAGALLLTMVFAALSGVLVPVALDKLGADPALSSGVFVTTVTDVIGFMSFLGVATMFLTYLLPN